MKIGKPILTYAALLLFNILIACNFSYAAGLPTKYTMGVQNLNSSELMMSYGVAKFKAGTNGIAKPAVNQKGGTFSYVRVEDGRVGGLSINTVSGWINYQNSNPGKYVVTYTYNSKKVSTTITVE